MTPREGAAVGGVVGFVVGAVGAVLATGAIRKKSTAINVGGLLVLGGIIGGAVIGAGPAPAQLGS
jgi:hypothetical protein